MFFEVIESHQVDGKTRVLIESDDSSLSVVMHLLQDMAEFAHLLRYRVNTHAKAEEWKRKAAHGEPERKAHYAQILSLWRSMKGVKPSAKVHRVQEAMRAEGREYSYSQVEAIVSVAIDDERRAKGQPKPVPGPRTAVSRLKPSDHSQRELEQRVRLVTPTAPLQIAAKKGRASLG